VRVAEVIGTVTLSRCHPSFERASFRLVAPLSVADLLGQSEPMAEGLVAYDVLGAAEGSRIAISEGREAASPFGKDVKPVDVYNAAILDHVNVEAQLV
jgi:ethanolamine utilization protein EutN